MCFLFDALQGVNDHLPKLESLFKVDLAAPTVIRYELLATDLTVLDAHLGKLLVDGVRIVASVLILLLLTGR